MHLLQSLCIAFSILIGSVEADATLIVPKIVPPIIDIAPLLKVDFTSTQRLQTLENIYQACRKWGVFSIVNHGIAADLQSRLFAQMQLFFNSSKELKYTVRRTPSNSRGFADDELTKQLKDSKEILDIGQEHFGNVSFQAAKDQLLDGVNMWPDAPHLVDFKPIMDEYYSACFNLSTVLFEAIVSQLPCGGDLPPSLVDSFRTHSSFLRLNMYPLVDTAPVEPTSAEIGDGTAVVTPRLGISRHTDAGVLTLLLQDSHSALEMYSGSKQDFGDGEWVPMDPVPGAITVNMGDMLQVWSNGLIKAPEHRVQASRAAVRYSAPFFFNPAYDTVVEPVVCPANANVSPRYGQIRWGDYRAQRFLGDIKDAGEEIQIEVFAASAAAAPAVKAAGGEEVCSDDTKKEPKETDIVSGDL